MILVGVIILFTVCLFLIKREFILYLLVLWLPLQNFLLPILYSRTGIGANYVYLLLISKDIMLIIFLVLVHSGKLAVGHWKIEKRGVITVLEILTLLIILYLGYSMVTYGREAYLRGARMMFTPVACILLGYYALNGAKKTDILKRYFNILVFMGVLTAIFGLYEVFYLPNEFWGKFINITGYSIDVKGESPANMLTWLGLLGNQRSRVEFSSLVARRLVSFYADPLSSGMAMSFVASVILYRLILLKKRQVLNALLLSLILVAIIFTQSRSAWLTLILICFYMFCKFRRPLRGLQRLWLWTGVIIIVVLIYVGDRIWSFVYYSLTMGEKSAHITVLKVFYMGEIFQPAMFIGRGFLKAAKTESGYRFVLYQMGYVGLAFFLIAFVRIYKKFRALGSEDKMVYSYMAAASAFLFATLFTAVFAEYLFTFTGYGAYWIGVGMLLKYIHLQALSEEDEK